MISVTMQFTTFAEAAAALAGMDYIAIPAVRHSLRGDEIASALAARVSLFGDVGYPIPFNDRPDVGAPPAALPPPTDLDPAAVFGSAVAPAPLSSPPSAPAPVAAPIAPTLQAPPVAASGAAPTLDKDGIPWDGRIHGATKALNADGTWRRKRNTADAEFEAVKVSLQQATAAQATAAPPPALAGTPITFGQLAMKYTPAIISKALPDAAVAATLAALGLTTFNQLMHAPALVPIADAEWSPLVGLEIGAPA